MRAGLARAISLSAFFDTVLPFGLRSAPFLFNMLCDALEWIICNRVNIPGVACILGHHICHNILITFVVSRCLDRLTTPQQCCDNISFVLEMLWPFDRALTELNIPIAPGKTLYCTSSA